MQKVWDLIKEEPVAFVLVVGYFFRLVGTFGFPLTPEQESALDLFLTTLLGWLARKAVTPNVKLDQKKEN